MLGRSHTLGDWSGNYTSRVETQVKVATGAAMGQILYSGAPPAEHNHVFVLKRHTAVAS